MRGHTRWTRWLPGLLFPSRHRNSAGTRHPNKPTLIWEQLHEVQGFSSENTKASIEFDLQSEVFLATEMSSTEQISRTPAKPRYSTRWRPEPERADLMLGMSFICNYKRQKSRKQTDKSTRHTEHLLNLFLESICTWGTVLSELLGSQVVLQRMWARASRLSYADLPASPPGGRTLRSLEAWYQASPINAYFTKRESFCFHLASRAKIQGTFLPAFFPLVTKPHVFLS